MLNEELHKKLNYPRAYRKTRIELAQWVLDRPEVFPDLLGFCFQKEEEISYRATWILEFVCLADLNLLVPHFDLFFKNLPKIYKDQAVRPLAKICEKLVIAYYKKKECNIVNNLNLIHKDTIIESCFDWLITDQKVACKVYSMSTLFYLGTEYDWIHPDLKMILEKNIHQSSAAYKARGRDTLGKIKKYGLKNANS